MTYDIELTFVGSTERFVSYTRSITFINNGTEYSGTLSYDQYEGYDWDGDELPSAPNRLHLLEELDALTCDEPNCYGCQTRGVK